MVVLLCRGFSTLKHVKLNMKYPLLERAERGWTWVMRRVSRLESSWPERWRCGETDGRLVSVPHVKATRGHCLMDAMLPPVDMLTVLHSLVPKGSLWLCVYAPRRSFDYLFSWTDFAGNGIHSNRCTWISQLPLNIYTCEWQSGTNEAFCLLYIWDFCI